MSTQYHKKYKKGFTLLEIILSITIIIVLAGAVSPFYVDWKNAVELDTAVSQLKQDLRFARARSLSGYNDSPHGAYFDINPSGADKIVVYQGSSYAAREVGYDKEYIFDVSLSLDTIITGNEINFSQGLGEPSQTGEVSITNEHTEETAVSAINSLGLIN
ncbi:prepilin-type N-terminal cleavage/methylation domain-containing protein [Candidatus Parcubacteria bacterium]|nr:prepilin-type N-terminal cleavage/methylation domain-containing protein [Candidatus Parcubacteria bacterium]